MTGQKGSKEEIIPRQAMALTWPGSSPNGTAQQGGSRENPQAKEFDSPQSIDKKALAEEEEIGGSAEKGHRGQRTENTLPASASAAANMAESHGPAAGVAGRMPTKRRPPASASDPHRLFEDTSAARLTLPGGGGGGGGSSSTPRTGTASAAGGPFLPDPVSTFAAAYGSSLATHGKELVDRNIDRFIPVTKLKYYFAVDTVYVGKKLGLLLFPFLHEDWQVQYQQDTPVAPRFDVNAPDLYIPAMAFITYILVAGLAMGTQNRFSPDLLGLQASSALAWLIVEVLAILLSLYLVTVNTDLSTIDLVAFSGYKYVGMILGLLAGLLFGKTGYYLLLSWCCLTIVVFMIRTLRLKILSEAAAEGVLVRGTRNQLRMYLTMAVAGLQPLLMYWLTFHLIY
ncbi:hypothetical protein JRQ81_011366 [Phrynocephalus forsythii]|uniref:Protein YIF1 n=1 Tax=Phrynocephalus forsythii TaxID=171643 RepID=A0A9Q0X6M5_9SAUR|nr:hypothetical protein JRQ81_011366 [Phrynocephalus forsythii]